MRPVFALQTEIPELILDKKKRRESFDNGAAKLKGFQDAGHQAKAVEDKLNKAAWFVISAKLSGRGTVKPADALQHANLPHTGKEAVPFRHQLRRRVAKLESQMAVATATCVVSPHTPEPAPAPAPAPEPAPAPAPAPAPTASQAKRIKDLEKQQKKRTKDANAMWRELEDTKAALLAARKDGRSFRVINQDIMNELEVAREKFESFCAANPGGETEELVSELKVMDGGRYSNTIRMIYYSLLSCEVSPGNCSGVVATILRLLGIKADRLPGRTAARMMAHQL